jgi:hypothetical protein
MALAVGVAGAAHTRAESSRLLELDHCGTLRAWADSASPRPAAEAKTARPAGCARLR